MTSIKSRKHTAVSPLAQTTLGLAALASSVALALPLSATAGALPGVADAPTAAQRAKARNLPATKVEADANGDYKVDMQDSLKFTQPILDTTQTVSIISKEIITEQAATTLTEALRNSAGVGTFYAGENGNTSTGDTVYMRGFDSSGSIFVDGVRDMGSISRDVFNVEQIEVTKGPASTDYGRTAPSGSINLVTKHAHLGKAVSAAVSYGSAARKRVTADWNQPLSDSAALRLNVMGQDGGVPGRDHVEQTRWGVAPSLAFGLGTPTRVTLDFLHVKQDNIPDGGVFTIGLPGYSSPDPERPWLNDAAPVDPSNFYGTLDDHDDVRADMATVRIDHDLGDNATLRNITRWGKTTQDYLLTSFMGNASRLDTPDASDPAGWTVARSNPNFKDQTNRILTNQTTVNANFTGADVEHDLSAGLELTREKVESRGQAVIGDSAWLPADVYHPQPGQAGHLDYGHNGADGHGTTTTKAVYLFDTLKFGTQWQLNAGLRLDRYDTDYAASAVCGGRRGPACGDNPDGTVLPSVNASDSGSLFSWKLGLLYKPAENGSVYANVALGQEPPGGNALVLSDRPNSVDNPVFDPQQARTTELGTKWQLAGDRLLLTAAIYRTVVSNQVVQDPVDQQYYQVGKKRVQGVELAAVGKLTDNWSLSAGYTTMDASVVKGSAVSEDGSSDLAYTPDAAFTAWTTWRLPFGLLVGAGARYNGEMKRGSDGAIGTPDHVEAYWVADAMASLPLGERVNLQLNINNLFDKDYVAAINKSGYRYTPGTPRSFMLSANVRF
ncbi:MAG TPA: catecholate siderophore receptor Fiu [Rhodanobacteraceae bacterium]|nr:catecholate siderophore receptor Fiu [Rhodanobacteraceae bacterium]